MVKEIQTAQLEKFESVLEVRAINDQGYDLNGDHRSTPLMKITNISAVSGSIIIDGMEDDQPKVNTITVMEAKYRVRALMEMSGYGKTKYRDDSNEINRLINMFIRAIQDANNQIAMAAKGHQVAVLG